MALHAGVDHLGCRRILTCATEHKAVLATAQHLADGDRITLGLLDLDAEGRVDLDRLEAILSDGIPTMVSVMHGNNEVGILQDIEAIGHCCHRHNAYFRTDTVQTMGHYRLDLANLPIDFAACSAHKLHGPKGAGFLYVRDGLRIGAHIMGGAQERAMRGGTENLIGIMGLAAAFDLAMSDLDEHARYIRALKRKMVDGLTDSVPGIRFNAGSDREDALYTVLSVNFPEHEKNGMLLFLLDLEGVACSGGSACSSGSTTPSTCCPPPGCTRRADLHPVLLQPTDHLEVHPACPQGRGQHPASQCPRLRTPLTKVILCLDDRQNGAPNTVADLGQ